MIIRYIVSGAESPENTENTLFMAVLPYISTPLYSTLESRLISGFFVCRVRFRVMFIRNQLIEMLRHLPGV